MQRLMGTKHTVPINDAAPLMDLIKQSSIIATIKTKTL